MIESRFARGQMRWFFPDPFDKVPQNAQKGVRPVIIVSDPTLVHTSQILLTVACTTQFTRSFATHVMFPLNGVVNIARCERIIEADKNQLGDIVGTVPAYTMEFIDIAIQRAFGLRPVPKENTLEIVAPEPPFVFPIPEVKTVFNSSNLNNMPIPEDWTEDKKNELCDMYLSSGAMKTAKYFHLSAKEVTNYYHQFRKR